MLPGNSRLDTGSSCASKLARTSRSSPSALNALLNSLRALAEQTGGRAVVNRNDFDDVFREIDAETSDYYVLGFALTNPDPTVRTRRLLVRVRGRPGVDVQHRTHYTYGGASPSRPAVR